MISHCRRGKVADERQKVQMKDEKGTREEIRTTNTLHHLTARTGETSQYYRAKLNVIHKKSSRNKSKRRKLQQSLSSYIACSPRQRGNTFLMDGLVVIEGLLFTGLYTLDTQITKTAYMYLGFRKTFRVIARNRPNLLRLHVHPSLKGCNFQDKNIVW